MLKENCFITELVNFFFFLIFNFFSTFFSKNLSDNNFSSNGCEALRDVLKTNNSITHLVMRGNKFNDASAAVWAEIISVHFLYFLN